MLYACVMPTPAGNDIYEAGQVSGSYAATAFDFSGQNPRTFTPQPCISGHRFCFELPVSGQTRIARGATVHCGVCLCLCVCVCVCAQPRHISISDTRACTLNAQIHRLWRTPPVTGPAGTVASPCAPFRTACTLTRTRPRPRMRGGRIRTLSSMCGLNSGSASEG
jgi:hypothetical protein